MLLKICNIEVLYSKREREIVLIKVITYGTYDLLHFGHIRLLERAKSLGDYLIVGITADDYDKTRGKINVKQNLIDRIEAVRKLNIADAIIVEEYEGQKIDDIKKYNIDIFTVGSDWIGQFDYLREYCKVVYLDRTQGISSSDIRGEQRTLSFGLVGNSDFINKVASESMYVNGLKLSGVCTQNIDIMSNQIKELPFVTSDYNELLENSDAIYIRSKPCEHYMQIKKALESGKHVLCESPITLSKTEFNELYNLAIAKKLVFMEAIKTAYSTAYTRLLLLLKTGIIGNIISVDAVCTSLNKKFLNDDTNLMNWNCIHEWGPTALLPIFQILGTDYKKTSVCVKYSDTSKKFENFIKADFYYNNAVASFKIGNGIKSEGTLVISGTKGYIYVPAPWWKTDYFEARYENAEDNKRYFYQLDGEGIRYELVEFVSSIDSNCIENNISKNVTESIALFMEMFNDKRNVIDIGEL